MNPWDRKFEKRTGFVKLNGYEVMEISAWEVAELKWRFFPCLNLFLLVAWSLGLNAKTETSGSCEDTELWGNRENPLVKNCERNSRKFSFLVSIWCRWYLAGIHTTVCSSMVSPLATYTSYSSRVESGTGLIVSQKLVEVPWWWNSTCIPLTACTLLLAINLTHIGTQLHMEIITTVSLNWA